MPTSYLTENTYKYDFTKLNAIIADKFSVKLFTIIFLALYSLALFAERIDFIIDIDGVLVDRANKETVMYLYPKERIAKLKLQNRVIELNGHTYILNEGAQELIEYLSRIPDANITFFSAGPAKRNKIFLEHFKTNTGRRFIDIANGNFLSHEDVIMLDGNNIPHKMTNWENKKLTAPLKKKIASSITPFIGPAKKDITKIPGLNLERAILIDDRLSNASFAQEKNLLNVNLSLVQRDSQKVLKHLDEINNKKKITNKAISKDLYFWNNRLALTTGIIDKTLDEASRTGLPINQSLWNLQWAGEGQNLTYNINDLRDPAIFSRGIKRLKSVNPKYKPLNSRSFCSLPMYLYNLVIH